MKKYNYQGCGKCPLRNEDCNQYKQKAEATFIHNRLEDNWGTPTKVNSKGDIKEIHIRKKDDIIYCATDEFDYINLDLIEVTV